MSVDPRGLQSSGVDDGPPPLQAFPPPGAGMAALLPGKGSISVVGVFSGISRQKPLGDMGRPPVLNLTFVKSDVGPMRFTYHSHNSGAKCPRTS
jgi:hypothetical protein